MKISEVNWFDIAFQVGWLIFIVALIFLIYNFFKKRKTN